MFTGLVEELGEVAGLGWVPGGRSAVLRVRGPLVVTDTKDGDSVSVNGVCLTVVEVDGDELSFDVMAETLARSALGSLTSGDPVNLERAVTVASRLGGHIVQGHVDGVGRIVSVVAGDAWTDVRFSLPAELARYLVPKGSICVDGISLTVVSVEAEAFTVSLIPTTLARTTLGAKGPGAPVNLEVDVIAKYVERLFPAGGAGAETTGGSI
jgi:riboflavin synthase